MSTRYARHALSLAVLLSAGLAGRGLSHADARIAAPSLSRTPSLSRAPGPLHVRGRFLVDPQAGS